MLRLAWLSLIATTATVTAHAGGAELALVGGATVGTMSSDGGSTAAVGAALGAETLVAFDVDDDFSLGIGFDMTFMHFARAELGGCGYGNGLDLAATLNGQAHGEG